MLSNPRIYSVKVSGIKCTNCAGKIKNGLDQHLEGQGCKISVNIMQETVTLSVKSEKDFMPSILQKLQALGYPAVNEPIRLDSGQTNERHFSFQVALNSQTQKLQAFLRENLMGITSVNRTHDQQILKFKISYNSDAIKGRQIADLIQKYDSDYVIINHRVESFKSSPKIQTEKNSLARTGLLCTFFMVFNMFLPFTGKWYDNFITFPRQLSIFSFAVILNLVLAGFVFKKYTKQIIIRAFKNYQQFGSTDMETLIALGCLSAFALCGLFFIKYGLQMLGTGIQMPHKAVMDINDALTSASIIVLVVNIGKYLEHKVKKRIQAMTDEIFPQSTLFSNMKVQAIQLQNRRLKIKGRKMYDSTVLEKGDIICLNSLQNSRLLLDVILISGKIRAQQSTTNGCDQVMQFQKGDRVQSGALVYPVEGRVQGDDECLAIVQNVFEKSMLIEIGTQIKFSQNQSDDKTEGIQAVCKSIASVFVKSVIILSLGTMAIWTALIYFMYVHLEQTCAICWVMERGIGVLVASCPCALGLAVPSVIAIVLNLATKSGILIKNNGVFQKMKITKKISFDKTGTLFTRINKIEEYYTFETPTSQQGKLWQILALVEKQVRHPLAEVLYKQAFSKCNIEGTNFNFILMEGPTVQKQGLVAKIRNKLTEKVDRVLIGNKGILQKNDIQIPSFNRLTNAQTQLYLAVGNQVKLVMRLNTHSNLRPEAIQVIQKIMAEGQQVHILSGDSHESVLQLSRQLMIPEAMLHAEHSSFKKMEWMKSVQLSGKQGVMMIGDGLNDIPCLQESAIGVSINAKSQLNINAADVVVLEQNLYKILALIRLLKMGNRFININLFWAFSYNIIIMPIVAGAFYKWDIWVSPIWSSIAMSLSSIIVVSISHLLSFFKFDDSLKKEKKQSRSQNRIDDANMTNSIGPMSNTVNPSRKQKGPGYVELIQSN